MRLSYIILYFSQKSKWCVITRKLCFYFTENVGRLWCYDIIRMSRPQWGVWSRWRRGCHSADAGVVASWLRSLRWTPASSFMYSGGESVSPAYVLILLSSLWFSSSSFGLIQRASLTSKDHPEILPCGDVLFVTSFLTFFFCLELIHNVRYAATLYLQQETSRTFVIISTDSSLDKKPN